MSGFGRVRLHTALASLLLLVSTACGGIGTTSAASPSPDPTGELADFMETHAKAVDGWITGYVHAGTDDVLIQTRFEPKTELLPFAQFICEQARKVVSTVTVEGQDGTDLWTCNSVASLASPELAAFLLQQEQAKQAEAQRAAQEAAARAAEEAARERQATQRPPTQQSGTSNGGACGEGYYRNVEDNCVQRPGSNPAGATAKCVDGSYSYSQHRRGTCSGHGGVAQWLKDVPP